MNSLIAELEALGNVHVHIPGAEAVEALSTIAAEGRSLPGAAAISPSAPAAGSPAAGEAHIRITEVSATSVVPGHDYFCSVWLDGKLVGKFYSWSWRSCVERAHDYLDPEEVKWLRITPNAVSGR